MRHIDAFCHFFPHSLFEKMSQTTGGTKDIGQRGHSISERAGHSPEVGSSARCP
jgi:hypothetical protein